jgi:hypothetical protein
MSEPQAKPAVSPRAGVAGTHVRVAMTRLPPNMAAVVGFGGIGSPHEILAQTESDANGAFAVTVRVPDWVERDRAYLFYWGPGDMRPAGFSEPFVITGPDGVVRIAGSLGAAADGCRTLHGEHEAVYALGGDLGRSPDGARVVVEATVAEAPSCGDRTTLVVRSIQQS